MAIRVEFFGIARQRAGVGQIEIDSSPGQLSLGEVLTTVGQRFPKLAADCLAGNRPRPGFIINLGGQRFISQPDAIVRDGECVLLLSADAGG
jgi:molybdopterin converting factor small subunit